MFVSESDAFVGLGHDPDISDTVGERCPDDIVTAGLSALRKFELKSDPTSMEPSRPMIDESSLVRECICIMLGRTSSKSISST